MKKCLGCQKELTTAVEAFFEKEDGTQPKPTGFCKDCWEKSYEVKSVCRADLVEYAELSDIQKIDMDDIADQMGDGMQDCYWDCLAAAVEIAKTQ